MISFSVAEISVETTELRGTKSYRLWASFRSSSKFEAVPCRLDKWFGTAKRLLITPLWVSDKFLTVASVVYFTLRHVSKPSSGTQLATGLLKQLPEAPSCLMDEKR